jgi:hypothetical protein
MVELRGLIVPPVLVKEVIMYFPRNSPAIDRGPETITEVFLFVELNGAPGVPNGTVQLWNSEPVTVAVGALSVAVRLTVVPTS